MVNFLNPEISKSLNFSFFLVENGNISKFTLMQKRRAIGAVSPRKEENDPLGGNLPDPIKVGLWTASLSCNCDTTSSVVPEPTSPSSAFAHSMPSLHIYPHLSAWFSGGISTDRLVATTSGGSLTECKGRISFCHHAGVFREGPCQGV